MPPSHNALMVRVAAARSAAPSRSPAHAWPLCPHPTQAPHKNLRLRRAQWKPRLRRCGTGGCGTKLAASPCLATPAGTNTSSSTCPVARPPCCTAVERSRARTRVHARGVNAVLALRSVRVPPAKPPAHTRPPYVPPDASLCNSCGGPLKNSPPAAGLAVCDGGGGRCELAPCCGCHNTPPPAALPIPRCA